MSIFAKARQVFLGQVNEALDHAIDKTSVPSLKQGIRDYEDGMEQTKSALAGAIATLTGLNRKIAQNMAEHDQAKARAQAWLNQNNEANARLEATHMHTLETDLASLNSQKATVEGQKTQLEQAYSQIEAKHQDLMATLHQLETSTQTAAGLKATNQAMKAATGMLAGVDGAGVDNLTARIQTQVDKEQAEFDLNMKSIATPEDPLKTQAVDDILNSLKASK